MARRRRLGADVWTRLLDPPTDDLKIARLYALIAEDLALLGNCRTDATRLGYALVLLYLRHPGRVIQAGEVPLDPLHAYVARQLGAPRRRSALAPQRATPPAASTWPSW